MLLNAWFVLGVLDLDPETARRAGYLMLMFFLAVWEAPLATAPVTLYLGQSLFSDKVEPRKIGPQPRRLAAAVDALPGRCSGACCSCWCSPGSCPLSPGPISTR